jgi:phosphoribosyl-dephospho-CoA transferase
MKGMKLRSQIDNLQVHDLVQIDPDSLSDIAPPCWVLPTLHFCPWVVVRRVSAPPGEIAVGVRGDTRDKRWAGFVCEDSVRSVIRPMDSLGVYGYPTFVPRTPAMIVLQQVIDRWQDLDLSWGPTGSVALELASGQNITTEFSDLDIEICAASRMSVAHARSLWQRVVDLRPNVDVRVETPECGFSLQEYASVSSSPILLRYRDCVRLGCDPWSPPPAPLRIFA